jgi:hypothetical protein
MESNDPSRALRTRRAVTYAPQRSGPTSAGRTRTHLPTPRPGSTSPPAWAAAVDLEPPPARVVLRTYAYDVELSSLVIEMECEFGREAVKTEREMRAADTPAAESRLPPTVCRAPKRRTRAAAAHPRWPFPAAFPGLCDRPRGRSSTCRPTRTYRQGSGPTARDRVGLRLSQAHCGVRYYARAPRVRELVGREVAARGAQSLIEVRARPLESEREVAGGAPESGSSGWVSASSRRASPLEDRRHRLPDSSTRRAITIGLLRPLSPSAELDRCDRRWKR